PVRNARFGGPLLPARRGLPSPVARVCAFSPTPEGASVSPLPPSRVAREVLATRSCSARHANPASALHLRTPADGLHVCAVVLPGSVDEAGGTKRCDANARPRYRRPMMKRWMVLLILSGACQPQPAPQGPPGAGPESAQARWWCVYSEDGYSSNC